jgi:hypothetical protein
MPIIRQVTRVISRFTLRDFLSGKKLRLSGSGEVEIRPEVSYSALREVFSALEEGAQGRKRTAQNIGQKIAQDNFQIHKIQSYPSLRIARHNPFYVSLFSGHFGALQLVCGTNDRNRLRPRQIRIVPSSSAHRRYRP